MAAEAGADVIAIRRGIHWHINPEKEIIVSGDILMGRGTASGLEKLRKAARGEPVDLG